MPATRKTRGNRTLSQSLSDQLLKLGMVDEKAVKKAKHQKRQKNKSLGRKGVEAAREARDKRANEIEANRREADRAREAERVVSKEIVEEVQRLDQIIESGRLQGRIGGRRRFYVKLSDGRVPYVEINDRIGDGLDDGAYALALGKDGELIVVSSETAGRVYSIERQRLLVWNRGG